MYICKRPLESLTDLWVNMLPHWYPVTLLLPAIVAKRVYVAGVTANLQFGVLIGNKRANTSHNTLFANRVLHKSVCVEGCPTV